MSERRPNDPWLPPGVSVIDAILAQNGQAECALALKRESLLKSWGPHRFGWHRGKPNPHSVKLCSK